METVRMKKKKGGRPTKKLKRELRITARFSKLEHYILQQKAGKAGINVSEFLRQAAITVKVTARLTEEERNIIRQLIGMANNLNQMAKVANREGMRSILKRWLYVAISNNNSVYDDDQERRNLIRFRKELRRLAEALYVINKAHQPKNEKEWLARQPTELREELEKYNQPTILNKDQLANPKSIVKQFCKRFTRQYTNREMRDWLEAVITYDGKYPKPVSREYLLIFYESLWCLIECAFTLAEKK